MKVITQLVQHFWSRQALTATQAEYLVSQGFVRAGDLPGFEFSMPAEKQPSSFKFKKPVSPPHPLEHVEEKLQSKGPAKRGRGKPKGTVLTEAELAESVEAVFARRAGPLELFRRWAVPLGSAPDWVAAAVRVRRATDEQILDALTKAIRKRTVALRDLWDALDVEPLHALIDAPDLRGPAPRAFRLLLTTDGPLPGPHTFLLKHAPLEAAKSMATAHRRLLSVIRRLHDSHAKLLTSALEHGNHPVVFWALAVLYNARRQPLNGPLRPAREYGPLPLPEADVWRQAWTAAMAMDQSAVTGLLTACFQDEQDKTKRGPFLRSFPVHCPLGWRAPS